MNKNIFLLIIIALAVACSPRKNTVASRTSQGFYTYYNTLFNAKDALHSELSTRDKSHKDNFYAPFIQILTYDEQPLGTDLEHNPLFSDGPQSMAAAPNAPVRNSDLPQPNFGRAGATTLEIAEAKALKAIAKHSMNFGGEEKNKTIFDAYMVLAQARLYMGKPLEALEALNYIFSNMPNDKRLPLAKIYQGLAYSRLQDDYRANETFLALGNQDLKKEYVRLKTIYYSEMLLKSGKKEEAIAELDNAFNVNKNRKIRSRIAFLRGQILASSGKNEEARDSFVTAYKYANDYEFETKSQIEIAKTFNGKGDDYQGAKDYLEKISKKGTYASRKNEFLYALGLMANKAGKKDEAQDFFQQSLKLKQSDPQIRGLTYYEVGRSYLDKEDYIGAGAYYDSALAVMNYAPTKETLADLSANIKKLSKNYYLVKKNDSILALTRMTEADRETYFKKYIDKIKEKEAKDALAQKRADHSKGFDDAFSSDARFASDAGTFSLPEIGNTTGRFYFDNTSTMAKGQSDFRRVWGQRQLADNWRTSATSTSIDDLKNAAMGTTSAKDPRRLETGFYIEKIPTDANVISSLKKDRDTASLGLGRMYEQYFANRKLATKTLYNLVDGNPDSDTKLQALYQIFSMNYESSPADADRAKQIILSEYPYTSYAEFVKNPKNTTFSKSSAEVENMYTTAFNLYKDNKFEDSRNLVNSAMEKFPKDALLPKFALLNAFNTGKSAGKEVMILQLEQIALNYPKTTEGEKAAEMLKYLKSDLTLEQTTAGVPKTQVQNLPVQTQLPATQQQQTLIRNEDARVEGGVLPRPPQQSTNSGVGVPVDLPEGAEAPLQPKKSN